MGCLVPFPTAVPLRAVVIEPLGTTNEDVCRAVIIGFDPSEEAPSLPFDGPLWRVLRKAREHSKGLPIIVHPVARRRAGQ